MLAVVSAHPLITEVFLTFAAPAQKQMQPEARAPQNYQRGEGKGGGAQIFTDQKARCRNNGKATAPKHVYNAGIADHKANDPNRKKK